MRQIVLVLMFVSILILSGCATNPVTRQSEFMVYSEQDENKLGKEYHPQVLEEYGAYDDKALAAYVNLVGQKVAAVSNRPNLDYTFTVLDSPIVNAFAVPGGYVYITRGLLEKLNSEDELAGVLGHEIGHVSARDGVRTMSAALGFNVLLVGASAVTNKEDFDAWAPWVAGGANLAFLNYGRDAEFRADELGSRYSTAAGYSPRGNTDVLRTLRRLGDIAPQSVEEFFATHPSSALRVDKSRVLQKELENEVGKIPERSDTYKTHIAGMVIGPNERHGQIIGNAYMNKMYDCRLDLPSSLTKTYLGEAGLLFYGKDSMGDFLALQAGTLTKTVSARDLAAAFEKDTGLAPVEGGAINTEDMNGWVARYAYEAKSSFISRFCGVENNTAYILTCSTSLADRAANTSMFNEALGSFRKLTSAEKAKLQVKRLVVHTVEAGQTLSSIARQYKVSEDAIVEYNALVSSALYKGQELKIPGDR
jgi:predicted Zn-dependent protease